MANQKSAAKVSSNNATKSKTKTDKVTSGDKSKDKNKKGLMAGIVVGVLVLVAVVVGVVCLISWLTIDYENTKTLADEANELRWGLDEDDSCYMVTHGSFYMGSGDEDDEFVAVLTNCKNDLLDFEAKVNALSGASGVRLDDEIKEKWEIFKESYDRAFPAWLTILSGANDLYEFLVNLNGITSDSVDGYTREKVDELVKPLLESSNEKMQEYGRNLADKLWAYISAAQASNEAFSSYLETGSTADIEKYREQLMAFNDASEDLSDYLDELEDNWMKETSGVDIFTEENDFRTYFDDVYEVIEFKYEENR